MAGHWLWYPLVWFIHHRHFVMPMKRKRWTPERQRTLREADWIVGWLRENGPASTREITEAMQHKGLELRAHVLNKALRKSPFIIHCGFQKVDGRDLSQWDFDRSLGEGDEINRTE
jgi:hypothetical protein